MRNTLNLGTADDSSDDSSQSDGHSRSEYVPSQSSSDSEDCILGEVPMQPSDYPKVAKIQENKIDSSLPQKDDDALEGDTADLAQEVVALSQPNQGCTSEHVMLETFPSQEQDELSRSQKQWPDTAL